MEITQEVMMEKIREWASNALEDGDYWVAEYLVSGSDFDAFCSVIYRLGEKSAGN